MTTRPEFGVPHPCYSGAAFYHRTADAFGCVRARRSANSTPLADVGVSHPCYSGAACYRSTADAFDCLTARRRCSGAPQLLQVVQASTRLPRRCRLAPGSPEGAGWLQAPPECAGWPYSPQMVQAGVSRCLSAPGVFGVVFRRRVLRPGGASVVPKWCRLAPGSPEGADRCYSPQMVQAGSRCLQAFR